MAAGNGGQEISQYSWFTVYCKRKGQLWLSKTVLNRLKDMEKDITLERFFLFTVKVILIRIINA